MSSKLQQTKNTKEGNFSQTEPLMGAHLWSEEKRIIKTVSDSKGGYRSVSSLKETTFSQWDPGLVSN